MASNDGSPRSCPSRACEVGVDLFAVMTASGNVAFVTPTAVDAAFEKRLRADRYPEQRFRFTGECAASQCPQWTGSECGVVNAILDEQPVPLSAPTKLPACAIRRTCRWYSQRGRAACHVCPSVVADIGGTRVYADGPFVDR